MKPVLNHMARKRDLLALLLMFLGLNAWMGNGTAMAEWRTPAMSDYVKVPVFSSYTVKPNIMVLLDNSGSMNSLAYGDGYTGTPYNGTTKSFPVELERDDMEENASGVLRDGSGSGNDLDFGTDYIGVRFQNVTIPKAATITAARIEFTAKGDATSVTTDLEIRGEASNDAPFLDVTDNFNISSRTMTTAMVSWAPGDWVAGDRYDSPDLTSILQEIVDQGDWASGNAMLFQIVNPGFPGTTSGHRESLSREAGQDVAPVLHVTYIDQAAGTRYYGYFNPDYFYNYSSGVFEPAYKKVSYDPFTNSWQVKNMSGASTTLNDSNIAPAIKANGLWDGNWMNWASMRRVDVLRKVLVGGRATTGTGGGDQQNLAESSALGYGTYWKWFSSTDGPATSPYKGNYWYGVQGDGDITVDSTEYNLEIHKYITIEPEDFFEGNLAGILQRIGNRARWGNMWFNSGSGAGESGGFVQNPIANGFSSTFLSGLQNQKCDTWTPLSEAMYVAMQYFAQASVATGLDFPSQGDLFDIGINSEDDPYWDDDEGRSVPCAKSFVLLLTDGASTKDSKIPSGLKDADGDGTDETGCNEYYGTNCNYPSGGTDFLDDVAYYARTTDLRGDLDGDQNVMLYTVYAFDDDPNARGLLQDAARNGGFEDLNGDGEPNGDYTDPAEDRLEWDRDGDGVPDTYFEASDGYSLQEQLLAAINDILKRASSGTAASVVSNSRSGEGAVYQSIFYPATTAGGNTVKWVGQVHALLNDAHGNIREDTNGNQKLDLDEDFFLVFGDETVEKYRDTDADGILDTSVDEGPLSINGETEFKFNDLNYLWSSNEWLNELTDPTTQRSYDSTARQRYIFTFVDADGDMAADAGEVKDFTATSDPSWAEVIDPANYFAYIHAYTPFNPPVLATHADFKDMVSRQIRRIVNFTRGQDQSSDSVGAITLNAFRNRQIDWDEDGTMETWRLGDIVNSTPTLVSLPAEDFDLIYNDEGYTAFYRRYQNRRNVVYVGSNDGMVHAFNSGFFDKQNNKFVTKPIDEEGVEITEGGPYLDYELGAELWAYVPFNLLSHLNWLTDPTYQHIYFNDLQPRVFDARIYPSKSEGDARNPNGWATIMVCGMRFGGGRIAADIDKTDGAYDSSVDKSMSSAYAIFDITNPEEPPILLGEISFPELGFTTCHPGVVLMRDFNENYEEQTNQWYLVFGSGPISEDGSGDDGANTTALIDGTSSQQAVIYAVDLVKLANDKQVVTLTSSGTKTYTAASASAAYYLTQFSEDESFVSRPISVDWDLDFNTDATYFGVTFGNHTNGWNGKLRRIVMENGSDPTSFTNWTLDSTLLNLTDGVSTDLDNGQPIVAAPTAGVDKAGNRWIFFGTGRFFSEEDKLNSDQQSYYGVMEPYTLSGSLKNFNYGEVSFDELMDVTNIEVYENGTTLSGFSGSFDDLAAYIEDQTQGWRLDFNIMTGQRNLGAAVLAGDVLTFTTYVPSDEPCAVGGESQLYALYYRTGTAYVQSIIGLDYGNQSGDDYLVLKNTTLGQGMTLTPSIHVGRETGSRAYIQTSTGAIKELEQKNPGVIKSGITSEGGIDLSRKPQCP